MICLSRIVLLAGTKRKNLYIVLCLILILVTAISFFPSSTVNPYTEIIAPKRQFMGVWINFYEFADMINGKDETAYLAEIHEVFGQMEVLGLNSVCLHVHSHSDSFYPSEIFPWSQRINNGEGVDYDPLAVFIQEAHQRGILVHAWFNPYRIDAKEIGQLRVTDPAYEWRDRPEHILVCDDGVYYNPASPQARTLVLSGVREVLDNYAVDGIHYDDYFYPTTSEEFDRVSYDSYCAQTAHPMALADWRRCQVNLLISGTYQLVQQYPSVVFGVSPAANWDNNYQALYADVQTWAKGGYVDYLCPQLYFGFEYPNERFRFDHLLDEWYGITEYCDLYIGLASYKVGEEDAGSDEWKIKNDLLARQAEMALSNRCQGICIYSYSTLMREIENASSQRMHLKKVLARFSDAKPSQ